jgi:hypothetical protein
MREWPKLEESLHSDKFFEYDWRAWASASIVRITDAIDDLDTKLAYHADNEPDVVAASQKSYEVGYEEGKAIAEPLLAATEFALTFEKGRVKVWREQNEALRARCERLARVVRAAGMWWQCSDQQSYNDYLKSFDALQPGDLGPSETKPA